MNEFTDNEIYAITDNNLRYEDCIHCLCRLCINMLSECKMCCLCEYECNAYLNCRWFVPYIFGTEPYKSYFRELEKLRGAKYDVIGRFE